METQKTVKIILTAEQMQRMINEMHYNQLMDKDLGLTAMVVAEYDSNWNAYVLKPKAEATQFSKYAECNGKRIDQL